MTTATSNSIASIAANRSFWSVALTVSFATITHAYEFGTVAFAVGAGVIAVLLLLVAHYRRTGRRAVLIPYGLMALWVIVGLGFVGGLWNHAVKAVVIGAHGGTLPDGMEQAFMAPELGSVAYESVGVLTFAAAVLATYFGYRFLRAVTVR